LIRQVGEFLKQKQKIHAEPTRFDHREEEEEAISHRLSSSSENEPFRGTRRERRPQANSNDFRVEIPEFQSKLDPDEFLE